MVMPEPPRHRAEFDASRALHPAHPRHLYLVPDPEDTRPIPISRVIPEPWPAGSQPY